MTNTNKFLEKTFLKFRVRAWLALLFFGCNFLIAHGAAMYWTFDKSPAEMIIGAVSSVALIFILSEPA